MEAHFCPLRNIIFFSQNCEIRIASNKQFTSHNSEYLCSPENKTTFQNQNFEFIFCSILNFIIASSNQNCKQMVRNYVRERQNCEKKVWIPSFRLTIMCFCIRHIIKTTFYLPILTFFSQNRKTNVWIVRFILWQKQQLCVVMGSPVLFREPVLSDSSFQWTGSKNLFISSFMP